jgi:hypothetical protein
MSITIIASASESNKSYLTSVLDEYDKPFEQCLKEHNEAFDLLEKNKSRVFTNKWTERPSYNEIVYHYDYQCDDAEMVDIVNKYIAAKATFEKKMYGRALGDGFVIGSLIALFNKITSNNDVRTTSTLAVSLLPLVHILVQNYKKEKVPYFDIALDKQDNKYATLSLSTLGRIACAKGAAWLGFLGSSFILHKVSQ